MRGKIMGFNSNFLELYQIEIKLNEIFQNEVTLLDI